MKNHNHHIVPIYKCIELGLTTSYKVDGIEFYFKENMVEVTREQHALIHWGYWCNDLKPLLEVCDPPQHVMDMIPLGDNRDMWAAQVNAMGEIDGIDQSGENNPNWKGGIYTNDPVAYRKEQAAKIPKKGPADQSGKNNHFYGKKHSEESIKKISESKIGHTPWNKGNDYRRGVSREELLLRRRQRYYKKKPAYSPARRRQLYLRKKQERQGVGTLEGFI